jgi:metallo-beta-lactamase class B
MTRAQAFGLVAALLLQAPALSASECDDGRVSLGDDLEVLELGEGLWRHVCWTSSNGVRFPSNGLVVLREGEALIVDTPWTNSQTERLLDWVEGPLGASVRHVIVTHSHPDNMGGIDTVHARGITTYGLELTAAFAEAKGNAPPATRFTARLELEVGGEPLEAWFPGAGHTRDNIVVWLPRERVLFGGCLVKSAQARGLGYTEEADLEAWPSTLQNLRQHYPGAELIVPGHGNPGGWELIENTLRLLRERAAEPQ